MDFNLLIVILFPFLFLIIGILLLYFIVSKLLKKWYTFKRDCTLNKGNFTSDSASDDERSSL